VRAEKGLGGDRPSPAHPFHCRPPGPQLPAINEDDASPLREHDALDSRPLPSEYPARGRFSRPRRPLLISGSDLFRIGPAEGRTTTARQVARSIRLLETVAEHAADQFVWPTPFTLECKAAACLTPTGTLRTYGVLRTRPRIRRPLSRLWRRASGRHENSGQLETQSSRRGRFQTEPPPTSSQKQAQSRAPRARDVKRADKACPRRRQF